MSAKNRSSEFEIDQNWINEVFVRKIDEIIDRRAHCSDSTYDELYEVISIAGLLRDLVYDQPLYERVNRQYHLKLQVPQWVMPIWPNIDPDISIASHYKAYCPMPDSGSFWDGGRWYPYSIPAYLTRKQPGFVVAGKTITLGEAIRLYANVFGGRHLDGSVREGDLPFAEMDQSIKIGKNSAIAHLLLERVAPDIIRALQPLVNVVLADSEFSEVAEMIARERLNKNR